MSLAPSIEISFIKKNPRYDPFNPILYVGGHSPSMWHLEMRSAAQLQWDGKVRFYVQRGLQRVNVIAEHGPSGLLHLRTMPDGTLANNLLSLDEFPFFYGLSLGESPSPQDGLLSPRGFSGRGLVAEAVAARGFKPRDR